MTKETGRRQAKAGALEFGRRVREARDRLGESQDDLGKKIGLTPGAVGQWELGLAYPSYETLGQLPSILHVSLEWLVYGRDKKSMQAETRQQQEVLRSMQMMDKNQQAMLVGMVTGWAGDRRKVPNGPSISEGDGDAVQLDAGLLREAREMGMDVSAALNQQLRGLVVEVRRERWLLENREALADANAFLAQHGLWSDGKRQF